MGNKFPKVDVVKTYPLAQPHCIVVYFIMYLRKINRQKDGKPHHYWALVKSQRTVRGPRQHVVAYLGEMDASGRLGLHQAVRNNPPQQENLFDQIEPEWTEIDLRRVHTTRTRRFGDVWLALELMKKLHLPSLLNSLLPSAHAKIPWEYLAQILIISRFCEPSSELRIAEHFYHASALPDIFGIPDNAMYDNRLYRTLDHLGKHKDAIMQHLKERFGDLFTITYDILLYDVTSTYFEGAAKRNPQAQRGYSRDSRGDCKQVCIGLVVAKEGIPLGYEVFEGNRHDSKTVETIVQKMEKLYGKSDRIWVMDRGMMAPDNIYLLNKESRRYIVGTPKCQLKKFEHVLLNDDWQQVRDGLEVKLCPSPEGTGETFILCRSEDRRKKEEAMHNRFIVNMEQGLDLIKKSCDSGRVKTVGVAERRIGRLLQKNQRAAAIFSIDVKEQNGTIHITWSKRSDANDWARLSEGCYLLRSNIADWSPQDLWKAYIQLTEVEEAFHIHKDDFELRPVWHQKTERVQAHILVCFLAYVLWCCMAQLCKQAGLGNQPRKVLNELKNIVMTDVVLPTRCGIDVTLRCVARPEKHLEILLQKLNLNIPERWEIK